MKKTFGRLLANEMKENDRIVLLAGDVGFGVLDESFAVAKDRAFNMGSSEQAMIGASVGLAYSGKIPICYTITPFLLYRPFEWIRNYLNDERVSVKLVGCGRDDDYKSLGSTHWCFDQYKVMELFPNIRKYYPDSDDELKVIWDEFLLPGPAYLNIRR